MYETLLKKQVVSTDDRRISAIKNIVIFGWTLGKPAVEMDPHHLHLGF